MPKSTPQSISEEILASAKSQRAMATGLKRDATRIRAAADVSEFWSPKERETLIAAAGLLGEAAVIRSKAASLIDKRREQEAELRRFVAKVAEPMFQKINDVDSKLAFVKMVNRHRLPDGVASLRTKFDARYLVEDVFKESLDDAVYTIARQLGGSKDGAGAEVAKVFGRYLELKPKAVDDLEAIIARVKQLLDDPPPAKPGA